MRQDKLLYLLF